MDPGHTHHTTRQPITVSLPCNHHVDPTIVSEGPIELPSQFESNVKETIRGLQSYDTIVIDLKFNSTGEHQVKGSKETGLDEKTMDARQLERILSTIYTLVEREKADRDELTMLQVDVLISGFSQVIRSQLNQPFKNLALGGTFDHLHSGHKILLTIACWLTSHTLIVGITGDELLKNKKYADKLEGVNERKEGVRRFIERVGPRDMKLEMPILQDVYGPTATEPEIDGLLVTKETVSGADSIDQIRATNHLNPLKRYVIDVISPSDSSIIDLSNLKDLKISSTNIRAWLHTRQHIRKT